MNAVQEIRRHAGLSIRGFTLVEVMVSLVILAVAALALTHLSFSVAVLMRQSGEQTELIAVAENRLEGIQARAYADIGPGIEVDTLSLSGTRYEERVTITAPSARLRKIRIDLQAATGDRQYSAITYVSAP